MMIIAWPIGMVISMVLLSLIYYGMFTPVALFFRLTGTRPTVTASSTCGQVVLVGSREPADPGQLSAGYTDP